MGPYSLTWNPEAKGQDHVNVGVFQYLLLVVDLHGDVEGGVDEEVGHEDVEEVGGDAGPSDGPVDEEANINQLEQNDQNYLRHREVFFPDFSDNKIQLIFTKYILLQTFPPPCTIP